jgi:hypothetical protein
MEVVSWKKDVGQINFLAPEGTLKNRPDKKHIYLEVFNIIVSLKTLNTSGKDMYYFSNKVKLTKQARSNVYMRLNSLHWIIALNKFYLDQVHHVLENGLWIIYIFS